jgi:hypothetical protein
MTLGITVLVHSEFRNFDTNCPKLVAHQTYEMSPPQLPKAESLTPSRNCKSQVLLSCTKIILLADTQIWRKPHRPSSTF